MLTRMKLAPRRAWKPDHPAGSAVALPAKEAWLHHTAAPGTWSTPAEEMAAMRALERIAWQRFRTTVSYTAVIFPSGRAYEGCGVGRLGSHTAHRNSISLGVAFAGDFTETEPTPAALNTAAELLVEFVQLGALTVPAFTGGHRDLKATACPGDRLYAALPGINQRAAALIAPPAKKGRRMLIRIDGGKAVFEVVGSVRVPVSAAAFKARRLDHRKDVTDVAASDPLAQLEVGRIAPAG